MGCALSKEKDGKVAPLSIKTFKTSKRSTASTTSATFEPYVKSPKAQGMPLSPSNSKLKEKLTSASTNSKVLPILADPNPAKTAKSGMITDSPMVLSPPPTTDEISRVVTEAKLHTDPSNIYAEGQLKGVLQSAMGIAGLHAGYISIVDTQRLVIKAEVGLGGLTELALETSVDALALASAGQAPFIVTDAVTDDRFLKNPLAHGENMAFRFFGAFPLVHKETHIGNLVLLSSTPVTLADYIVQALSALSKSVMTLLLEDANFTLRTARGSRVSSSAHFQRGMPRLSDNRSLQASFMRSQVSISRLASSNRQQAWTNGPLSSKEGNGPRGSGHGPLVSSGAGSNGNFMPHRSISNLKRTSFSVSRRVSLEATNTHVDGTRRGKSIDISAVASDALDTLNNATEMDPFTDVTLGTMLGRGAYGRCFKGDWKGTTVAVKVLTHKLPPVLSNIIDETSHPGSNSYAGSNETYHSRCLKKFGALFEAFINIAINHPNVVCCYRHATRLAEDQAIPMSEEEENRPRGPSLDLSSMLWESYIVLEFCDIGTLRSLVDKKVFWRNGMPLLSYMLLCLRDACSGLIHIHSKGLNHGDLTPNNILCVSMGRDARKFICKIADYGLTNICSDSFENFEFGTPAFAACELFELKKRTLKADVYSFGVCMVELFCGEVPWSRCDVSEIIRDKREGKDLDYLTEMISSCAPADVVSLAKLCLARDPEDRPEFEEVLSALNAMLLPEKLSQMQQECLTHMSGMGGSGGHPSFRASSFLARGSFSIHHSVLYR